MQTKGGVFVLDDLNTEWRLHESPLTGGEHVPIMYSPDITLITNKTQLTSIRTLMLNVNYDACILSTERRHALPVNNSKRTRWPRWMFISPINLIHVTYPMFNVNSRFVFDSLTAGVAQWSVSRALPVGTIDLYHGQSSSIINTNDLSYVYIICTIPWWWFLFGRYFTGVLKVAHIYYKYLCYYCNYLELPVIIVNRTQVCLRHSLVMMYIKQLLLLIYLPYIYTPCQIIDTHNTQSNERLIRWKMSTCLYSTDESWQPNGFWPSLNPSTWFGVG